jgi:hypothetical protein
MEPVPVNRILSPLFVLALAVPAAATLPASLTAHLKDAARVHLDFAQTRTLAALSRPLRSSGSMVLARDQGVIWAVRRPLSITYVIGPKGLLVVDGDGHKERRTAREAPMVAQLGKVFQALAQGDLGILDGLFTAAGTGTPERWQVELLPKAGSGAASFVQRIRLDGGRFIDRVRLEEAAGDRMELVFSNQKVDAPLTPAEAALLAQE